MTDALRLQDCIGCSGLGFNSGDVCHTCAGNGVVPVPCEYCDLVSVTVYEDEAVCADHEKRLRDIDARSTRIE